MWVLFRTGVRLPSPPPKITAHLCGVLFAFTGVEKGVMYSCGRATTQLEYTLIFSPWFKLKRRKFSLNARIYTKIEGAIA